MFESSLIDLKAKDPRQGRRWISLPVAIGIHFLALGSLTFASYWNVAEVPEPETNVVFVSLTPPAPPPPIIKRGNPQPRQEAPRAPATKPVEVRPDQPVQPDLEEIPDKPASLIPQTVDFTGFGDPSGSETGSEDGVIGGSEDGVPGSDGHVPGGTGTDPGGSGAPGPAAPEAVRLTAEMTRPVPVRQVQPRYTEAARRAGVQGVVVLEAIIDERGNVSNVRVLRGLPMGLDREAVEAVQQWKYRPALLNGRPVRVYMTLTAQFTIQR
jgi:protein TonB